MARPITPEWASSLTTDILPINGQSVSYINKEMPPVEIRTNGILAKTPFTLTHVNYQFDKINENLNFLKRQYLVYGGLVSGTHTVTSTSLNAYHRWYLPDGVTEFAIEATLGEHEGDRLEFICVPQNPTDNPTIRLVSAAGHTITFNTPTGLYPKTNGGKYTKIYAIKVGQNSSTEAMWDVWGDLANTP